MTRKILPYFVLALILTLLLAACGGADPLPRSKRYLPWKLPLKNQQRNRPRKNLLRGSAHREVMAEEGGLPDLGGREITIAVENAYLPFNYIDPETGEPAGWDYDVWDEICRLLNCTPVYVEASWEGMIQAVADGQFDAAADGITITEDRAEIVDFSEGYINIEQRLLVRADEDRIEKHRRYRRQ